MRYTVVWSPNAERKLADLWLEAVDRSAVRAAADQIDDALRTNPNQSGESRSSDRRILLIQPLGVIYRFSALDQTARVLTVWRFETRPPVKTRF